MNAKRVSAILIIFIVCITAVFTVINAASNGFESFRNVSSIHEVMVETENMLKENLPFSNRLKQLAVSLRYWSGDKNQNGIYISGDRIFKILEEPDYDLTYKNTESIINFADTYRIPTYAMIVPTASAIKQQEIDTLSRHNLFNEKVFIEDIYTDFSSHVSSVNIYPTLFSNKEKYIYYNTESNLTGLGGYYVYEQLAKRLNVPTHNLEKYEIKHYPQTFYGDIYENSPYRNVSPDTFSTYNFTKFDREYRVTRTNKGEVNTYYELYPEETLTTGKVTDIFLGGEAEKIEIEIGSPNENRLLIYGDKTVMSYLPFLAVNYDEITFINTDLAEKELMDEIDIKAFDQVLFSYSVDSFAHKDCLKNLK